MSIPARILVVDDQAWVRHTLRSLLAQQGLWRIYEAANGKVALDLIHEIEPHVVVADLVMPGMNGIELAYEIRQLKDAPKIILISSHYTPEEAAVLARLFGDGNFVPKSEAGELLVPAISRLLPEECQAKVITA
jgi:two-component system, response regulator, stage 0 sporulation protein F